MNGNISIVIGSWGSYNECKEKPRDSRVVGKRITDELKKDSDSIKINV